MKTSLRKIRVTRPSAGLPSYPQPLKPTGADGTLAKKRVLVVEDQSAVCDLVSEMVQSHPRCVSVGTASDGLSAIELALRLKPDILVLDVIMPGVGGIEILRRLGGSLPAMKVLIFSGKQEPHIVRALMQAGIHGFVNKNGPLSELRKALEARVKKSISDTAGSGAAHATLPGRTVTVRIVAGRKAKDGHQQQGFRKTFHGTVPSWTWDIARSSQDSKDQTALQIRAARRLRAAKATTRGPMPALER